MAGCKNCSSIVKIRKKDIDGMKKILAFTLALSAFALLSTSCINDNEKEEEAQLPTDQVEAIIEGVVAGYNEFNAIVADVTKEQMDEAGFILGDEVTVIIGGKSIDMPYYDGYYNKTGEYLLVAYPTSPNIFLTRNTLGVPDDLSDIKGQKIVIKLKKRGCYIAVQQALGMVYSNKREDYASDAIFANERVVNLGHLATDRLYRSASPFDDKAGRARYASALMEKNGIKTVLNLSDTQENILSYELAPYSKQMWEEGNVILCPLRANPADTEYNQKLIAALKVMGTRKGPYLVHCVEGKDRTGYVCALLEGLCGATYDEIVDDYLITYDNYYGVNPKNKPEVCSTLVSIRLNECLMHYANIDEESALPKVDFSKAFADYLLAHGMNAEELGSLISALTE